MNLSPKFTSSFLTIGLLAFGCSPKEESRAQNRISGKPKVTSTTSSQDSQTASPTTTTIIKPDETILPPIPITGAFLYCETVPSELPTKAFVGCKIADINTKSKVNIDLSYSSNEWSFGAPLNSVVNVTSALKSADSPYHVLYTLDGGTAGVSKDFIDNLLVAFKATPAESAPTETVFSARLVKDSSQVLPEDFVVYFGDGFISYEAFPNATKTILPTVNRSYIACYSASSANSAYALDNGIYVMGQYRVKGVYSGPNCVDSKFPEADSLAKQQSYTKACSDYIPSCSAGNCWGGGATGGWFDL